MGLTMSTGGTDARASWAGAGLIALGLAAAAQATSYAITWLICHFIHLLFL